MSPMRLLLTALLVTLVGPALAQDKPQMDLPRVKLSAGMYLIDAQVAQTPEQRQIGLMFREKMPAQEGMLFVFEEPGTQCFWMKNTLAAPDRRVCGRRRPHREPGRHEAPDHRLPLLHRNRCATCWR